MTRYLGESDSNEWRERLRVVGADYRSAADAFALVHETKLCLQVWVAGEGAKFCLLINNAAQTLTDSVNKEERATTREDTLRMGTDSEGLLIDCTYKARVRGGAAPMVLEGMSNSVVLSDDPAKNTRAVGAASNLDFTNGPTPSDLEPYSKSSWVQSLFEIPYEDVMSVHAVNTFVPLILCRELLPLMGRTNPTSIHLSSNRKATSSTFPLEKESLKTAPNQPRRGTSTCTPTCQSGTQHDHGDGSGCSVAIQACCYEQS